MVRLNRNPVCRLDNFVQLTGRNHFPGRREYQGQGARKKSMRKDCRVFRVRGRRTPSGGTVETTWICKGCPGQPGLCVDGPCFEVYHTKFDYSK